MINHVYQLIKPKTITVEHQDISLADQVIVRPAYMAVCHADQRYYQGKRDAATLRRKLPMALIHECCGRVVYDPTGTFRPDEKVVMIPNTPPKEYPDDIYENYAEGATFRSSGYDGFMQELVAIEPDRVVGCDEVPEQVAAITEFVSVAVHASTRFDRIAHAHRERIGIWGDGSLAFVVANVLHARFPESKLYVFGKHEQNLAQFSFVEETHLIDEIPADLKIDHGFECCGGNGSASAIADIIAHIRPQGTVMLMGVSELPVPVNTRMVLEKGLTMVGSSRSGREDFELAVHLLGEKRLQRRLKTILYEADAVRCIEDIHRVFQTDQATRYKTVFRWEI